MYLEIKEELDSPNLMGPPCSSEHFKLRWRSVWVGVGGWEGEGCSSIPYWSCIWCLKRRRGQRMPCSCWGIFDDLSIPVWQDASLFRWWILDAKLQIAWGTDWQTYIEYLTKTNWQSKDQDKDKDRYNRLAKLANLYWVTDKKFCARKYYRKTMTSN